MKTNIFIAEKIHDKSLGIFKIYNKAVRTPENWQEERARLLSNPSSRARWKYNIPKDIEYEKRELQNLYSSFKKTVDKDTAKIYLKYLPDVVGATVNTAVLKCEILLGIKNSTFQSSLQLRKRFYALDYNYPVAERLYSKLLGQSDIQRVGRDFDQQATPSDKAAEIVKKSIPEVREKIRKVIFFPVKLRDKVVSAFDAQVEVIDDPSFSMRCITDPKSLTIKILLNKRKKYSEPLLKIAYLHEFCGHALEMALFDKTLVKDGTIPRIYNYAGVSSPNIFDVKAEVFADLMVAPFVDKDELKYVRYRRDVWLVCRAMADYLYNIKGKTIKDVMEIYENVGLENFAFDEAIMASIFIDGYQGVYLFANQEIEKLQKQNNLNDKDLLTLLLYLGKIPISSFKKRGLAKKFLEEVSEL